MRFKSVINLFAILSTFICFGQFEDYNNTIGFVCGGSGSSTPIIHRVFKKMEQKKYNKIIAMLYSKNPAENFLAVVLCEKLNEKEKIKLKEKDLQKIAEHYNSEKTIEVCGGCTFMEFVKLSILLKNEDENKTRDEAEEWLKEILTE
jgi:hypothetical protein